MKINLIPNWRVAYKYLTVQLAAVMLVLSTGVEVLPMLAAYLPTNWVQIMAALILLARMIQQAKVDKGTPDGAVAK